MTIKKAGLKGGVCVYPFSPVVAGTFLDVPVKVLYLP